MTTDSVAPVALITGASSGFGREAALALRDHGWSVFGASRHPAAPEVDGIHMLPLDVRDPISVNQCVSQCLARAQRLDVLVNNAGYVMNGFTEEASLEEAHAIFETNFFGLVRMTNAVLPHFRQQRAGRIINVSSLAGRLGAPYRAYYCPTKFAVEGYSESLALELHPFNIHVSLIEPGFFQTNLSNASAHVAHTLADYDSFRTRLHDYFVRSIRSGGDPAVVGRLIARVAACPRPKLRYRAGRDAKFLLFFRSLLPERLFLAGGRKYFHIP